MLHSPLAIMGAVIGLLVCGFALLAGSKREQIGATVYLGGYTLSYLSGLIIHDHTALRLLISDSVCLVGFLYLCWKAPNPWPLWAFGAQLLTIAAEIASATNLHIRAWTLITVSILAGYGVLIALVTGTFAAVRARKSGLNT